MAAVWRKEAFAWPVRALTAASQPAARRKATAATIRIDASRSQASTAKRRPNASLRATAPRERAPVSRRMTPTVQLLPSAKVTATAGPSGKLVRRVPTPIASNLMPAKSPVIAITTATGAAMPRAMPTVVGRKRAERKGSASRRMACASRQARRDSGSEDRPYPRGRPAPSPGLGPMAEVDALSWGWNTQRKPTLYIGIPAR